MVMTRTMTTLRFSHHQRRKDANAVDQHGFTAFSLAIDKGFEELILLLVGGKEKRKRINALAGRIEKILRQGRTLRVIIIVSG